MENGMKQKFNAWRHAEQLVRLGGDGKLHYRLVGISLPKELFIARIFLMFGKR